ncbi:hypothetical protein GCM10010381_07000 [Streptomyces xantholiticus]|nr:hypothetical protein GCM10010381_07000 [Streptomyces xantholiticus]
MLGPEGAEVLGPLRIDGVGVGAIPVRGVAWSGFGAGKSPLHRARAEAWPSPMGKPEPFQLGSERWGRHAAEPGHRRACPAA